MTPTASFGRRGRAALQPAARPQAAALTDEIALTPEQRALIFAAPEAAAAAAEVPPAGGMLAANLAALSVTLPVVALTFHAPHGGGAIILLSLGWQLFSIGSDLALNLWLTRKICRWFGWSGAPAFFLAGAAVSWSVGVFNKWAFGLVAAAMVFSDDLTPALAIPAGGAVAALYVLLAGRGRS